MDRCDEEKETTRAQEKLLKSVEGCKEVAMLC